MKIVELKIDELDDLTGFEAVALVGSPAHESPFYAFKQEDILDLIQFEIIKLAVEEERLSQEVNNFNDLPSNVQENLLETLAMKGIKRETLENEGYIFLEEEDFTKDTEKFNLLPNRTSANPKGSTADMKGKFKILYQYRGPKDEKNRDFCRRLLDLDLLFRKEDIDQMSLIGVNGDFAAAGASTYDILQFKGGIHCRHTWKKVYTYQKQNMSSQNVYKQTFATDGDNQMVVGPLLIPDKLIFRMDENGDPYFVYFSKETVIQIANKMMKSKLLDKVNLEHDPEDTVEGYMVESWVITDKQNDKSNAYGFSLPDGTWMGMYKIESSEDWKKVKEGDVTGFSIEGFFADKLIQA